MTPRELAAKWRREADSYDQCAMKSSGGRNVADVCLSIAKRECAQELDEAFDSVSLALATFQRRLVETTHDLPPDAAAILRSNLWELYSEVTPPR